MMFPSASYAEWTKVAESEKGDNFYVDFERIRKHGGYVYFWELLDYLKPDKWGDLSSKSYKQGDCKLFRYKVLDDSFYTEPMGQRTPSTSSNKPDKEWRYPSPNSVREAILKSVCDHVK